MDSVVIALLFVAALLVDQLHLPDDTVYTYIESARCLLQGWCS